MDRMQENQPVLGQEHNNTQRIRWQVLSFFMMVYDFVAVGFAWFAVLWGRFDFRFSQIPGEYYQAYGKFIVPYAIVTILLLLAFRKKKGIHCADGLLMLTGIAFNVYGAVVFLVL